MEKHLHGETPIDGLQLIDNFLSNYQNKSSEKSAVIFANHTEFDVAFLKSYYDQYEKPVPWKYNKVFEINSILLGAGVSNKADIYETVLKSKRWEFVLERHFHGVHCKHDAYYDCMLQIEVLMYVFNIFHTHNK